MLTQPKMRIILFLVVFFVLFVASVWSAFDAILTSMRSGTKVYMINPIDSDITNHPYTVAINHETSFVCAGALLNRVWVLALASCTEGAEPSDLYVRLGSNNNSKGGVVYNLTQIVIHPKYNYTTLDYDYALLMLSTFLYSTNNVPIFPFNEFLPKSDVVGIITGWGSVGKSSLTNNTFNELKMSIIANTTCMNRYKVTRDLISDRMFCAVAGNSGPCYNDFGNPFVVNGTLYGLFSWSRGCANPKYPAVFSNLATVKNWIYSVMNNACICGVY